MKRFSTMMAAALLATSGVVFALEQQTKDKINAAGDTVTSGVKGAIDAVDRVLFSQRTAFQSEAQAALDEAKQLQAKLNGPAPTDSAFKKEDAADLRDTLQKKSADAQEKLAALKNANEEDYSGKYKDTKKSIDELQDANYKAAAWYTDVRRKEEARAEQQVKNLKSDIDSLQANAGANDANAHKDVQSAVKDLRDDHQKASQKLEQLKTAPNNKWASLRSDLDDIVDGARDNYQKALAKAKSS